MIRTPNQMTLNLLLAYWQRQLRVRDWDVSASMVRREPTHPLMPALGWSDHSLQNKRAKIELLDPRDYDPAWQCDIEHTLVHELLHLHFAPFEYKTLESLEGISQEQTLNLLACALVNLKRGQQ